MRRDEIDVILSNVFAAVFRRPIDIVQLGHREVVEDWDSLKHMEIIFAVEAATGIVFSEAEIGDIKSIQDLRQKLSRHDAASN